MGKDLTPEEVHALETEAAILADKLEKQGKIVKGESRHKGGSKGGKKK